VIPLIAIILGVFAIITKSALGGWMAYFGAENSIVIVAFIHALLTLYLNQKNRVPKYLLIIWQFVFLIGALFQFDMGDEHSWTVLDHLFGDYMNPNPLFQKILYVFGIFIMPLQLIPWHDLGVLYEVYRFIFDSSTFIPAAIMGVALYLLHRHTNKSKTHNFKPLGGINNADKQSSLKSSSN